MLEAVEFSSSSRMVDAVRRRRKIQPPPRESKYSRFFDSSNLLYLHNCRHDVRRHIREAKCVDIRHKTTCRVTIDTCPLLSLSCTGRVKRLRFANDRDARQTQSNKTGKKQRQQQQRKRKIPVSLNEITCSI